MAKTLYEAIGMVNGKPAGHVCYGRTKLQAMLRAKGVVVTVKVKRCIASSHEAADLLVKRDAYLDR